MKVYVSDVIRELLYEALDRAAGSMSAALSEVPRTRTKCPRCGQKRRQIKCSTGCGNIGSLCPCTKDEIKAANGRCKACQNLPNREILTWYRPAQPQKQRRHRTPRQ